MNSEERREVAERLREVDAKYIEDPDDIAQALAVCVTPETSYNFADFPPALFTRLADLIDPTCHVVGTTSYDWSDGSETYIYDLSCGHAFYTGWPEPPAFCQDCGARAVTDDD